MKNLITSFKLLFFSFFLSKDNHQHFNWRKNNLYFIFLALVFIIFPSSLSAGPKQVSISDVSQVEGDNDTTTFTFTVTATDNPSGGEVIAYTTSDGTATSADNDYDSKGGNITFSKNINSETIIITVNGDTSVETDETFTVAISLITPSGAISSVNKSVGIGTILNDDLGTPPSISGISDQSIMINTAITPIDLSSYTTAAVGDTVTYTSSALPAGLTLAAGVISGTPTTAGVTTITVTATGNDGSDSDDFTITVTDPSILTASIADASIAEGDSGTSTMAFTVTLSATAPLGGVTLDYATTDGTATAGSDYTAINSGTLMIAEGNITGSISISIIGDTNFESPNETFTVTLSNPINAILGTSTAIGTIINDDAPSGCPIGLSPEFTLNIYGNESNITGISNAGDDDNRYSIDENYWEFNATALPGYDINGTLRVTMYSADFKEICNIQLLDENCGVVSGYSWQDVEEVDFGIFVNTDTKYYLYANDTCGNNPQQGIVSMLWYPDVNASTGGAGGNLAELAIFKGTDVDQPPATGHVSTKIVNEDHDLKVSVIKDDGSIYTLFKGFFTLELVNSTDHGSLTCKELPLLKYDKLYGIKNNDNGQIVVPALNYDRAVRNVSYRMTYLVDPGDGGLINYDDLITTNGCLDNSQNCLWGVLQRLASTKQDPNLPSFTIADVCGLYCDPGNGTGNNQASQECAQCVFGQFGYADCSDNFAIRPNTFDANITSTDVFTAGDPTSLSFKALDGAATPTATVDYNETENISFAVDINISDPTKVCENETINMTPIVTFTNGLDEGDFTFNDIGDVNMTIHEIIGTEFAIIDASDTNDSQRLIGEFNVTFQIVPDHFNIEANLTDHNTDNNFTYLHDINKYNADDNYAMGALLSIDIEAVGADDNITRNYMETCYAKDTNVTLGLNGTTITYPGSTQPLDLFVYYNPVEDNGSVNAGEGNTSLPAAVSNTITLTSLNIENIESTFPSDAPDGNGTTHIEYKLNFDRKQHLTVNPFQISVTDANITDTAGVQGSQTGITDQNATMYYARSRASKFFYEDITEASVTTPIIVDIYCDLGPVVCDTLKIDTVNGAINDHDWWLSLGHSETTQNDGNITLVINLPGAIIEGDTTDNPTVDTDVTIDNQGQDSTINVTSNATEVPMTVLIDLDQSSVTDTNHWLIYNRNDAILTPSPFYKVRFIGEAEWTGEGQTGHVVDLNASYKKSQRVDW